MTKNAKSVTPQDNTQLDEILAPVLDLLKAHPDYRNKLEAQLIQWRDTALVEELKHTLNFITEGSQTYEIVTKRIKELSND